MKRIISSILVIVMLALSLASCGYDLADDDMTSYATFSEAEKKAFEDDLVKILIKDGNFSSEDATREQRVMDSIYAAVANAMGSDAKELTEGKPDNRDVIYYSYYMSAKFGEGENEEIAIFYPSAMKSSSAVKIQLRGDGNFGDDTLSEKIAALLKNHDFKDMAYVSTNTGTTFEGDIAYVTYTTTEGDNEPVVHTNKAIVIGPKTEGDGPATSFESHLCGVTLNSSVKEWTQVTTGDDVPDITYSNIKVNFIINRTKSGTTAEGDKAFVTYTKKVGDDAAKTVTNELIIVGKAPAEGASATTLAELISAQKIGSKLVKDTESNVELTLEVTEDDKKVVYSAITVNWIQNDGAPLDTVIDTPFDEKTLVKDVDGTERDLNGKEITYYIYPVKYVDVEDFTPEFLIKKIIFGDDYGSDSQADDEELLESAIEELCKLIYADEYSKLAFDEDATSEEMEELLDSLAKKAEEEYVGKDAEGKDLKFSAVVKLIVDYYKDIKDAEESKKTASDKRTSAQTTYDEAERKLDEAKNAETRDEEQIAELEQELAEAKKALDDAEKAVKDAEALYDACEAARVTNIKTLLDITRDGVALSAKFTDGYKIVNYYYLQYSYNEEIRNKLAEEIYFFIIENVKMHEDGDLPSDLVDNNYTHLFESYENAFYTGNYDSTESNYSHFDGSFSAFLVEKVTEDIKAVTTRDEAEDAIREKAEEIAIPMVKVFRFADFYDQTISNGEYEDYKDEIEEYYYNYYGIKDFDVEEIYGKDSLKMAAQLDKLLDWMLEYEESEPEAVGIYSKIKYEYKCPIAFGYDIGDPASKGTASDAE